MNARLRAKRLYLSTSRKREKCDACRRRVGRADVVSTSRKREKCDSNFEEDETRDEVSTSRKREKCDLLKWLK